MVSTPGLLTDNFFGDKSSCANGGWEKERGGGGGVISYANSLVAIQGIKNHRKVSVKVAKSSA